MEKSLEKYLETIEKYLKPLPASERADIVLEIKSSMLEMQNEGLVPQQIAERLGNPRELAKAYLGDLIAREKGFSWNRFLTVFAFYSLAGFSGLFIIPVLAIIAPVFIICGVVCPLLGIVKLVDYLLNLGIPYVEYIRFQLGNTIVNPAGTFFLSLITGIVLYLIGKASWKLLLCYIKSVSKTKNSLSI